MTASSPPIYKRKGSLEPREHAIFRHVWPLSETERRALDAYYLLRIQVATLLDRVNQSKHHFKDYLLINGREYEIQYIQCNWESLEDLPSEASILLSVRRIDDLSFNIVLVKPAENLNEEDLKRYRELV